MPPPAAPPTGGGATVHVAGVPLPPTLAEHVSACGWDALPRGTQQLLRDIFVAMCAEITPRSRRDARPRQAPVRDCRHVAFIRASAARRRDIGLQCSLIEQDVAAAPPAAPSAAGSSGVAAGAAGASDGAAAGGVAGAPASAGGLQGVGSKPGRRLLLKVMFAAAGAPPPAPSAPAGHSNGEAGGHG